MDAINEDLTNLNLESGEDRISNLPESVLTHILSRLTTKDAVSTCVLSKSWETKWTCIHNLHFDDNMLYSRRVTDRENFSTFVGKTLHYCQNSKLESFTLLCSKKYDPFHITQWLSIALRQGVRSFCLRYRSEGVLVPSSFLGCESLEEASLTIPSTLKVSPFTSFVNLKILHLARMRLGNDNAQSNELSFCFPILEIFSMFCCTWVNVRVIKMEAPCLSTFKVSWCKYENGDNSEIKILGSHSLRKFKWASDDFLESFTLPRPPSVCEAVVDHFLQINDFWRAGVGAVKLLKLFSSLIHLEITIDIAEALDRSGAILHFPMLNQVIYLKLESRYSGSTRALMSLLRKTPNVRCLEIHTSLTWKNDDYELIGTLPLCVMCRLERVYFTYRYGASVGFHLMTLLLQNAHVLQLMHVYVPELPSFLKTQIRLALVVAFRASQNVIIDVE